MRRLPATLGLALVSVGALTGTVAHGAEGPFTLDSDEFPIGVFSVDSEGAMKQVAKMGVGFVHTYANGRSSEPEGIRKSINYLNLAEKHGLRVMFNLNGRTWVAMEDGLERLLVLVNAVKDHPALGFWYFYDEPDGTHTPEQLLPFYRALKKATPVIPVAVATAWSKKWSIYNDTLDLLMIDNYPVQHLPFPQSKLNTMTTFTESALGLGKPVIPINQCFNWKILAGKRETYRGSPSAQMRYPTGAEIRYWCYSGAAQGVRGMFWWSYYHSIRLGYTWINTEFADVVREFKEFTEVAAPAHKPERFPRARDVNVIMGAWRNRAGGSYFVLVNAWPLEQDVSRWTEDKIDEATLKPWGSTRNVDAKIENGRLNVGIAQPWEVFVWEMETP